MITYTQDDRVKTVNLKWAQQDSRKGAERVTLLDYIWRAVWDATDIKPAAQVFAADAVKELDYVRYEVPGRSLRLCANACGSYDSYELRCNGKVLERFDAASVSERAEPLEEAIEEMIAVLLKWQ